jgi:hypothetical protein
MLEFAISGPSMYSAERCCRVTLGRQHHPMKNLWILHRKLLTVSPISYIMLTKRKATIPGFKQPQYFLLTRNPNKLVKAFAFPEDCCSMFWASGFPSR